MKHKKTTIFLFIYTAVMVAALLFTPLFEDSDAKIYDTLLGVRIALSPRPLNSRIVHIDLNDSSDNELAEPITSRLAFADAMQILGELGVYAAFDIIWQRPGPNDSAMAEAAETAYSMIFSAAPTPEDYANAAFDNMKAADLEILAANVWNVTEYGIGRIPEARSFIMSNPEISRFALSTGHIGVESDNDRVYRRMPLFYRWQGGLIPCLALVMAAEELMIAPEDIEVYHGREVVLPVPDGEPIRIPIDIQGRIVIPYTSLWEDMGTRVSFSRVVNAKYDEDEYMDLMYSISGQLAMIADTTTAKKDFGISPMEKVYPLSGIHSSILSGILDEYFFYPLRLPWRVLGVGLLALAAFFMFRLRKDWLFHTAFLAAAAVFLGLMLTLWFRFRIIPWISLPAVFIVVLWAVDFIRRLFLRYHERYQLELTFSRYLSPELVKTVTSDPAAIRLGGQKRVMTALFTDLESFSEIAEAIEDPVDLTTLLNFYLGGMSDIILDNRGTIDKFEGDAIMSFFGAPVPVLNHAAMACRSAVLMKRLELIQNAEIAERQLSPRPLFTRIGINTGEMMVGNMGTLKKMDYTVMGSAVNIASRLEGVNKQYFTGILMGGDTKKAAGDGFISRRLDRVRTIGINSPVTLWELIELREDATQSLLEMAGEWEIAITHYEHREYGIARKLFRSLADRNPGDKTALLFAARCAEYMGAPPAPDWDGVINLTMK